MSMVGRSLWYGTRPAQGTATNSPLGVFSLRYLATADGGLGRKAARQADRISRSLDRFVAPVARCRVSLADGTRERSSNMRIAIAASLPGALAQISRRAQ